MSFADFYRDGGVFMHQILLCGVIASAFVFRGLRRVRDGEPALRAFELASGLVGAALIFGVLGLTMGVAELCGALQTIPTEQWPNALARATPITTYPLGFATMIGGPIWAFVVGGRYAARRPRPELDA
jgi:hypothetical protein